MATEATMATKIDNLLTVRQVAERLHMNPYTIRELLRDEELKGYKIRNRRWRVKESDLEKFIRKYRRR